MRSAGDAPFGIEAIEDPVAADARALFFRDTIAYPMYELQISKPRTNSETFHPRLMPVAGTWLRNTPEMGFPAPGSRMTVTFDTGFPPDTVVLHVAV